MLLEEDPEESLRFATSAVARHKASGNTPGLAQALCLEAQARCKAQQSQLAADLALEASEKSLEIYRSLKQKRGGLECIRLLCPLYKSMGMPFECMGKACEALALARSLGDRRIEAWALQEMAEAQLDKAMKGLVAANFRIMTLENGEWTKSKSSVPPPSPVQALNMAAEILRELGDEHALAMVLLALAEARLRSRATKKAAAVAEEARQLLRNNRAGEVKALLLIAMAGEKSALDAATAARDLCRDDPTQEESFQQAESLIASIEKDGVTPLLSSSQRAGYQNHQLLADKVNSQFDRVSFAWRQNQDQRAASYPDNGFAAEMQKARAGLKQWPSGPGLGRHELKEMTLIQLYKLARVKGADYRALDEAMEGADPKIGLVNLLVNWR